MWRTVLLVALPPLANASNHDVISAIMIVRWTCAISRFDTCDGQG